MRTDARFEVVFCLSCNLIVLVGQVEFAAAIKAIVVVATLAWTAGRRRLLAFAVGIDFVIGTAVVALTLIFDTTAELAVFVYLRWSVVAVSGVLLVGAVGIEEFLRVLFWFRLPNIVVVPIGFAIRSIPVVQDELAVMKRCAVASRLAGGRRIGVPGFFRLVESTLVRSISRVDHMVSQLERRGFSTAIFGRLDPFRWTLWTVIVGAGTAVVVSLVLLDRVL